MDCVKIGNFIKKRRNGIIGLIITIIFTLFFISITYFYEYQFTTNSSTEIETKINEIESARNTDAHIVRFETIDDRIYYLFQDKNHEGNQGLFILEKGLISRYKFVSCEYTNDALIKSEIMVVNGVEYIFLYCANELPLVKSYGIYDALKVQYGKTLSDRVYPEDISTFEYSGSPFISLFKNNEAGSPTERYYDEKENEISRTNILEKMNIDAEKSIVNGATVNAEQWIFYFYEIIITMIGICLCIRFIKTIRDGRI